MPSIIPVRRIVLAGGAGVRTFAAWNSADKVNITLSDIDTKATNDGGGLGGVRSVTSHASGKWYFEFTVKLPVERGFRTRNRNIERQCRPALGYC